MNNENNNINNGQNVINTPVIPTTTPVVPEILSPTTSAPVVQQPVTTPTPMVQQQIVEPTTTPVIQQPVVPNTEVPTNQQPQVDNNAMVNENLQKVEINNYTPPSKFKIFILLVLFALIVAFIIFLPQISSYLRNYGNDNTQNPNIEETITTGKLVCTMTSDTSDLDKEHEFDFSFTDSKLKKTKYTLFTRGDSTTETLMDEANEKCKLLKDETKDLEGITIRCDYTEGKLTETQVFDLEIIDNEKVSAAFTEAGGMLPSYKYDQDIDSIEKNMKASGYTCEREK